MNLPSTQFFIALRTDLRMSRGILSEVRKIIPPLSSELHKGQAGRVAIVGGSLDYTGAPFFSAMSSMKLGCDMSHNICEPSAGAVIKTYSPDCIVHGYLKYGRSPSEITKDIDSLCDRLHTMVVGPGLGRDEHMQMCGRISIEVSKEGKGEKNIDSVAVVCKS